jgi:hypothetical protein
LDTAGTPGPTGTAPKVRHADSLGRLRILISQAACRSAEEVGTDWEILMSTEVELFLDDLYETDRDSHQLVN